jgi:hypothetical protein
VAVPTSSRNTHGSGHTDSGADEQAQLEAGMRESLAAAGVKPKRGARAAKVH